MAGNDSNTKLLLHANAGNTVKSAFCHMIMENNTDSGSGANAVTNIGTPTYTAGQIGNALTLTTDQALNIDALRTDIINDTTGSFSFWVNPDAVPPVGFGDIITFGDTNADSAFSISQSSVVNRLTVGLQESAGNIVSWLMPVLTATWQHIAIVQDGVALKVYRNAVDVTDPSPTETGTGTIDKWFSYGSAVWDNGRIGCRDYASQPTQFFFEGQIDDVRYYQASVLSQTEVTALYNAGTGTENSIIIDASTHDDLPFSHMALEDNTDDGTGANPVTDIGTPTYTAATGASQPTLNNALTLDGSTDALNIDALANDIKTDTTGSAFAWVNTNDILGGERIFTITSDTTDTEFYLQITGSSLQASLAEAGVESWNITGGGISASTWHHVGIVHDGRAPKLYLDGVEVGSFGITTDTSQWLNDLALLDTGRIGCRKVNGTPNGSFFDGQIDDFRYYRLALTPTQVTNLYNSGTGTETAATSGGNNPLVQTFADAQIQESVGGVQVVPDAESFGGYAQFDGSTSYLTVPDSTDWDVVGNAGDDWTIDLWVRHDSVTGSKHYINQWQDASNRWNLLHQNTRGIGFSAQSTADGVFVQITSAVGQPGLIEDTEWHHVALIKVGQDYGTYLDGVMSGYALGTATATFSAVLQIGQINSIQYFPGSMDECRISSTNIFSGAPDAGLTDTITVPTSPAVGGAATRILLANDTDVTTDTGVNTHTVTNVSGNVDFKPGGKWNSASLTFDGTGDYLSIPDSANWDILGSNTSDYTLDVQAAHSGNPSGAEHYLSQWEDASNLWLFLHNNGLQFYAADAGNAYWSFTSAGVLGTKIEDSNWHHAAFIKTSSRYGLYQDGVQVAYQWVPQTMTLSAPLTVAQRGNNTQLLTGNMDEVRVQADNYFVAAPNSFPAAPLLIYGDSLKGGYGEFDGTDRLTIPDHADWSFGTGDFVIETWVRFIDKAFDTRAPFWMHDNIADADEWVAWRIIASSEILQFFVYNGTVLVLNITDTWIPENGVWYHIAVVRSSGDITQFVNGVALGSPVTFASAFPDPTGDPVIGHSDTEADFLNADLDEFRVSKGTDRGWSSGFTPSTSRYLSDTDTKLLIHFDQSVAGTWIDYGNTVHTITNTGVNSSIQNEGYGDSPASIAGTAASIPVTAFTHMVMNGASTDTGTGANAVVDIGTPTYTAGHLSSALTLNGTDQALNLNALEIDIDTDTAGSVSAWFNTNINTTTQTIYALSDLSATNVWIRITLFTTGNLTVAASNAAGTVQWRHDSSGIVASTWYHIVVVQDGVSPKIYLDGADITNLTTTTDETWWNNNGVAFYDNVRIGQQGESTNLNWFDGQIDDFRYYRQTLNAKNIADIYALGVGTETDMHVGPINDDTALFFDGNSDFLTVTDTSGTDYDIVASTTDSWTMDAWIRLDDDAGAKTVLQQEEVGLLMWRWYHATPPFGMTFGAWNTAVVMTNGNMITGNPIPVGKWTHVAWVKVGDQVGMYTDGVQDAYDTVANPGAFNASLFVGKQTAGSFFDGNMEQVQITKANKFGVVPLPEPYLKYNMNDNLATTVVLDTGSGGFNGTTVGGNTDTFSTTGKLPTAAPLGFNFDGATDWITADGAVASIVTDTTGTLTAWINPDTLLLGDSYIFALSNTVGINPATVFSTFRTLLGKFNFNVFQSGGNLTTITSNGILVAGAWNHIAVVQDGVQAVLYLNGVADTATAAIGGSHWFADMVFLTPDVLRIGVLTRNIGETGHYAGKLDDVRYYRNEALSASQIQSLYSRESEEWGEI